MYITGLIRQILHPYITKNQLFGDDFGWFLEWWEGKYDEAQKSYDDFNARIEESLNAGVVTLYPSLDFLDDLVESIVVKYGMGERC